MKRVVSAAAAIAAFAALSCSSMRPLMHPFAAHRSATSVSSAKQDTPWWQDPPTVRALALTSEQRMTLDVIDRRAQEEMTLLERDAQYSSEAVRSSLSSEPFDPDAYGDVADDFSVKQARVVARDLQRIGEIRQVLTVQQWAALQRLDDQAAIQLKAKR